jgi:hypothetical protein
LSLTLSAPRPLSPLAQNYPLIASNVAGGALVAFFGGRKFLQHPDIRCDIEERSIQDTTPATLENAVNFRRTTSHFSAILGSLANKFHAVTFGSNRPRDHTMWDVSGYNTDVPLPLEHTSYFNDGLFKAVPATPAPTGVYHAADDKE